MATLTTTTFQSKPSRRVRVLPKGELVHRSVLGLAILAAAVLIFGLTVHGYSYYSLSIEQRPLSPLHSQLRSSGSIGLRLGFLSVGMFGVLFLYPLRKRWRWLSTIGITRRWLNFHVFFGIATPCVVTFHTSFKFHGLAGLAYWTMIAVALSGFVGRYMYAKIPRGLNSVALTMAELESQTALLASRLREQDVFRPEDMAPLLSVPSGAEIRSMGFLRALWIMLRMDLARPFQISRLRRRVLRTSKLTTLGGFLSSHVQSVEFVLASIRRQSRLRVAMAFLDRTARVFDLWHVIHRPFSISFVALIAIHIGVALSVVGL